MVVTREATFLVSAGALVVACANGAVGSPDNGDVGSQNAGFYVPEDGGAKTTPSGEGTTPAPTASAAAGEATPIASGADAGTVAVPASPDASSNAVVPGANLAAAAATPAAAVAAVAVPTIGGCPIYPADNPWNTRVDDPQAYPVHPNSATYLANMSPGSHLHADWGDWSGSKYGIPWETVPGTQPMVPVTFEYADESDPGPYPLPADARVEGGAGSGGDMHVVVLDTGTCTLYETYASTFAGPGWSCGSGAKFDLTSNELRPDGFTSADAAGLPILPGLVRVAEVQAGAIHHAIRFTVSRTQQGFIHPATHAAGTNNASLPPLGLRLRLKASFDASKYTGAAAVILTAMKQYGVILADNGSNWFVSGDSDDAWLPLMDDVNAAFGAVHGSDFEAVQTGDIIK
jgi:hypothetical protein